MEVGAVREGREKSWRPQMTEQERRVGWAFFALYLVVFPFVVGGVVGILDERLGLSLAPAQSIAIYYAVVLLLLVTVFWDFLRHAAIILRENLRPSLFILAVTLLAGLMGTVLAGLVPLPVENQVLTDYKEQFMLTPGSTVAVAVLLRPLVEEILYRGLLFGSMRKRYSRAVAYGVSAAVFALACVWQNMIPSGSPAYLLLAIQYLPLGICQCWCYDVSGSVLTPMALRVILNGWFLGLALLAG